MSIWIRTISGVLGHLKPKILELILRLFPPPFWNKSESDDEEKLSNKKRNAKDQQMRGMKAELKRLLSQPLLAKGISARYITSGSRPIVDDLLAGERECLSEHISNMNLKLSCSK